MAKGGKTLVSNKDRKPAKDVGEGQIFELTKRVLVLFRNWRFF